MKEVYPDIEVEATLFRYYKQKKSSEVKPSKDFVVIIGGGSSSCREDIGSDIGSEISSASDNSVAKDNTYIIKSVPYAKIDGKEYFGDSAIIYHNNDFSCKHAYKEKDRQEVLVKTFNYILGILGVALCHGKLEKARRGNGHGIHSKVKVTSSYIRYEVLSNFWCNNPFLSSLILGIGRDCVNLCADLKIDMNKLFSKIDEKEIYRVIDEVDYRTAKSILNKYIIPFFSSPEVAGYSNDDYDGCGGCNECDECDWDGDCEDCDYYENDDDDYNGYYWLCNFLYNSDVRELIAYFMKDKIDNIFPVDKVSYYWNEYSDYEAGIEYYYNDVYRR